jgi:hypothetical protein
MSAVASRSPLSGMPLRLVVGFILLVNGLFPAPWILLTSLKLEPELTRTPITWNVRALNIRLVMSARSLLNRTRCSPLDQSIRSSADLSCSMHESM